MKHLTLKERADRYAKALCAAQQYDLRLNGVSQPLVAKGWLRGYAVGRDSMQQYNAGWRGCLVTLHQMLEREGEAAVIARIRSGVL